MTNHRITQIRDLKVVLKEMERLVKNPRFLRTGRKFTNFDLLPREAWANLLLCFVGNFNNGNDHLTFADDPTGGDGIIVDKETGDHMLTEHVFIPTPRSEGDKSVPELMVEAVAHKAQKGEPYARGKHLVIFSEAIGIWHPNRVAKAIAGNHAFNDVWCVALQTGGENGYVYGVTLLNVTDGDAPICKVTIESSFADWTVERLQ